MDAFTINHSDIARCPRLSLSVVHYRHDGTCYCTLMSPSIVVNQRSIVHRTNCRSVALTHRRPGSDELPFIPYEQALHLEADGFKVCMTCLPVGIRLDRELRQLEVGH